MRNVELIKSQVAEKWSDGKTVEFCVTILDFIDARPRKDSSHLTFNVLAKIVGQSSVNQELLAAVTILSAHFTALNLRFLFIDEDGAEHYLDDDEAKDWIQGDVVAHPESGKLIQEAEKYLFPYYEGNKSFLEQEVSNA